jgi:curli biogenesis system outer membrane secretion channel CsgG
MGVNRVGMLAGQSPAVPAFAGAVWIAGLAVCGVAVLAGCAPRASVKRDQAMTATKTQKVESKLTGPKRRIGVVDFENKSAYGQNRLGSAASDILITELTKTGKFVVVERDKLAKIMDEQKLQASGAIDPKTVVRLGKILGLNAIVTGVVSSFGEKTEGTDFILVQSKQQIAQTTIDVRVVDTETGQVLYADSGKGIGKSTKRNVLGMGGRGGYDESLAGDTLRAAIVQFTDNIVQQVNKKPWSCRIAAVRNGKLYLNAGPTMGVEKGLQLDCYHLGAEVTDPTTGLVIGHEEVALGRAVVEGPLGDTGEGSVAKLTRATGPEPAARDICRLAE